MERKVFKIFGKVLVTNKPKVEFNTMNSLSMKLGIFVPENLCYEWLFQLLKKTQINPNSTFYQSWRDITSKSRWQLFVDQVRHYASTYGTNFEDEAWLPERAELPEFPFKELKVLEGTTLEALIPEIQKLGYSNIAFSEEVLDFLFRNKQYLELDKIQNRTLKMMCIPEDYSFKDGQECLNWILWKFFDIKMLVKNKETLEKIVNNPSIIPILTRNKEVLASVFFRNKDVFMRLKKSNPHIINVIRKLANKLHKPMKESPWLQLDKLSFEERGKLFSKAPIFKLVQMYNVLNNPTGYYVIRNGKAFYKESVSRNVNQDIVQELLNVITDKIPRVKSVALPKGIELAMPTSEKNFVGDIPLGSSVNCAEKDTMIGIYWRNEWNAIDLDLHVRTIEGYSIGWNGSYYEKDEIIFSGDMTTADPEATEVMYFANKPKDSIVSVSEYRGYTPYSYDVFIAQENPFFGFSRGYMVDPRNIIFQTRMNKESRDNTLGFFKDGKFIFHSMTVGSGLTPTKYRSKILEHLVNCSYLTVREVLELANVAISEDAEIKLNTKGELINFFSNMS